MGLYHLEIHQRTSLLCLPLIKWSLPLDELHTLLKLSSSLVETTFLLSQGSSGQFIKCVHLFTSLIQKERSHSNMVEANIQSRAYLCQGMRSNIVQFQQDIIHVQIKESAVETMLQTQQWYLIQTLFTNSTTWLMLPSMHKKRLYL